MRRSDDMPLDPFAAAELDAIEAALAGREVDPEHAELAELSVLLATDQQYPDEAFTHELDAMIARRFDAPPARPRARSWSWRPALAAGVTAALAGVAVVLALQSGGSPSAGPPVATAPTVRLSKPERHLPATAINPKSSAAPATSQGTSSSASASFGAAGGAVAAPAPASNGRRQIRSAQVTLRTSGKRIDTVAQEVFNVASRENGIVNSSQVTQGRQAGGDFATFNLGIPTANLQDALELLSRLQFTHIVSRTDAIQDVTNRYASDRRRLADARALRTSLLKQLETAHRTNEIDSLNSQIHDAEAAISRDETRLHSLQHRISYSSLNVQVNQNPIVYPVERRGSTAAGGLTLGRAAHDAGQVLVVAAGVILIGLAALVPIGLVVALIAWIAYWLRRRRREQALDAA